MPHWLMWPMTPSPRRPLKGAARWLMQRDRDQCFIQVEAAVVDLMRVTRVRGESYSEVILRLVELKQAI